MGRIKEVWTSTKYKTEWDIYYRFCGTGSILDINCNVPFAKYDLDKKYWAADPLVFSRCGKDYLFFELFDKKNKKGKIAVSEIYDNKIAKPSIVLDLDVHLSFPFVFEHSGSVYMIPETGQSKNIRLFKATDFPFEWQEVKVLVTDVESSDNVACKKDNALYLIASIKDNSPSCCRNVVYVLNNDLSIKEKIYVGNKGVEGVRNAGQLFAFQDKIIRPGQDCSGEDYGKGLIFWEVLSCNPYSERMIKKVSVNNIRFIGDKSSYSGVHTYSSNQNVEFIDLRRRTTNTIIKRSLMFVKRVLKYMLRIKHKS